MKKTILCILIILTIGVISTLSIYKYNNLDNKKEKTANDVTDSSSIALILIDENGNETNADTFPSSNEYYLNFAKSYCENGSLIGWDSTNSKVRIISSKSDDCKLYFNKGTGAVNPKEDILASNTLVTTTPSFSAVATDINTNIYQAEDDLGTSYYFRGAATQNYVNFGGFYWRIVRINGDGTIRMIYDGTSAIENGVDHSATIGKTAYNTNYDEAKHVGYTYDDGNGNQVDSTIKGVVEEWYRDNLESDYGKYISDSIFCNDREITRATGTEQYFAPYVRLDTNKSPVLTCTNLRDRYTVKDTVKGNGLLTKPIGLITADEILMAGGKYGESNSNFYLYTGLDVWSMSPHHFSGSNAYVWFAFGGGEMEYDDDIYSDSYDARPVINLRADLLFTGSGTVGDPYKVAGFE